MTNEKQDESRSSVLSARTSLCTEEGEREASCWDGPESLEEELGRWCQGDTRGTFLRSRGREEPVEAGGDQGPKALKSKERIKTFTGCGVLCQVYTGEGG